MGIISKIDDVAIANIAKVDDRTKATIANISGQTIQTYTDAYGVELDGTNDYIDIALSSDPINKTRGTISVWMKIDASSLSSAIVAINNYASAGNTNDFIQLQFYRVSTSPSALAIELFYRSTVSGTTVSNVCNAKAQTADHGIAKKRLASAYGTDTSDTEFHAEAIIGDGAWHNVVATWDTTETLTVGGTDYDGKMKMYIDGVLRQEGQSTNPSHNGTGTINDMQTMTATMEDIFIGVRQQVSSNAYNQFVDGQVNDVAIWDTDLDADAITAVYNSGQPMDLLVNSGNYDNSSNLIGYWKFEENTGTTVYDSSSNSNNGTLTSGAAFVDAVYPLYSVTYQFEGETTQEGYTADWSPSNGWVNGSSATDGTYWGRTSNKTVKGWNLGQDGTGSGGTGPNGGVNISDGSHYTTTNLDRYMYTEVTGGRNAYAFVTRMPVFNSNSMVDATNDVNLKFWVHAYGSNIGDLYVYIHTAATANHSNATELAAYESFSGYTSNSSVWQEKTISLNSYRNATDYYIYFVSQNGTGFRSDLAVDAVQIIES